jgi:hypothetical protein
MERKKSIRGNDAGIQQAEAIVATWFAVLVSHSRSVRSLLCTRGVKFRCFYGGKPPQIPEAPRTDMQYGDETFI